MLVNLKTFNGHNINDGADYTAYLLNPHGMPDAAPVFLDQIEADSIDAGTYTVAVQQKVLDITVRDYANRYELIAQLKTWLKRGTQGLLVATFIDDGTDYQMLCRVVNVVQDQKSGCNFQVVLQTGVSEWRAVNQTVESTWNVTGTSETQDIDVGGKDETFLSLELTTVAGPSNGYLYQDIYQLPNTPALEHGLIPWCITVDTATLVSGSKMQADCDDLRIVNMNTGLELKRWISNPNNASTKVWINLNLSKGYSLPLLTAVAGSGSVTYLEFEITQGVQASIAEMPKAGIVYHGNEWFSYTDTDPVNCKLLVGTRALFGTTEEAHSPADVFLYIQYPLLMKYGNSSVGAPSATDSTYDDDKPLFSLSSSTNTSWVWSASDLFYDPSHPNRTGGWQFTKEFAWGPNSKYFHIVRDATSGNPALGFKIASFETGGIWKNEYAKLFAGFYRAAEITTVTMTGESYRTNANFPAAMVGLQTGVSSVLFGMLWVEASPPSTATWGSWATHSGVSLPSGHKYMRLIFWGGWSADPNSYAMFEALTCTAVFNSSNIPTGAFLGEESNYPLIATLENLTTGESVTLDYMMLINKTFTIDGETSIVQYDGHNAYGSVTPNDESRSVYLHLTGNTTNTIQISGADLGELDIILKYYARRL